MLSDDDILITGAQHNEMVRFSFATMTYSIVTIQGIRKDYPISFYDNKIYQPQNINSAISTAEFEYLFIYDMDTQTSSKSEMYRGKLREGAVQGVSVHNGQLVFLLVEVIQVAWVETQILPVFIKHHSLVRS